MRASGVSAAGRTDVGGGWRITMTRLTTTRHHSSFSFSWTSCCGTPKDTVKCDGPRLWSSTELLLATNRRGGISHRTAPAKTTHGQTVEWKEIHTSTHTFAVCNAMMVRADANHLLLMAAAARSLCSLPG